MLQMAYKEKAGLWQNRDGPVMLLNSNLLPFVPLSNIIKTEKGRFGHVYWETSVEYVNQLLSMFQQIAYMHLSFPCHIHNYEN